MKEIKERTTHDRSVSKRNEGRDYLSTTRQKRAQTKKREITEEKDHMSTTRQKLAQTKKGKDRPRW
jgi:hypothetical protein